jgi:acetyltransferase-like isoleucine patch superfamily enzyme
MNNEHQFPFEKLLSCGVNVFISDKVEFRRPHFIEIGSNVSIDSGVYITSKAKIGNYVHIGPYVTCVGGESSRLVVGNFVTIAAGARLICLGEKHLGDGLIGPTIPADFVDERIGGEIVLEDFASVGTNAIILPGVTISRGSVVGAGSVISQDTEPWKIYLGNPARIVRERPSHLMENYGLQLMKNIPEVSDH